ncbi:hypothetical protein [Gordonia neofelifaecis]|uniref:Uncharacterized protein n=1 Tax=Gordonia neofelifaecis NRRL B-59395 TaxID=644548 RepID=F1YFR0_9ACTN|nr:hypothetical protein [Gordonia neofelifaecis]EGD56487.1 hypothetical protein SCNU_03012 [Gordonia neofelifaecis NRRL B-59395]
MSGPWEDAFGVAAPPSAPTGARRWAQAVDLGARGRAAAARTIIDELVNDRRTAVSVVSLALATRASLTRQAGRHASARVDDGAALSVLARCAHDEWTTAARVDALIGLAADALGIGDFGGSRRLLDRAEAELRRRGTGRGGADRPQWVVDGRLGLREAWVRTELALYSGDATAGGLAAEAAERAESAPSSRHRTKTSLIVAAATAASGDGEVAAVEAARIAGTCEAAGLLPLEWAARTMLAGLRDDPEESGKVADLQAKLASRGMAFVPLTGSTTSDRYA